MRVKRVPTRVPHHITEGVQVRVVPPFSLSRSFVQDGAEQSSTQVEGNEVPVENLEVDNNAEVRASIIRSFDVVMLFRVFRMFRMIQLSKSKSVILLG